RTARHHHPRAGDGRARLARLADRLGRRRARADRIARRRQAEGLAGAEGGRAAAQARRREGGPEGARGGETAGVVRALRGGRRRRVLRLPSAPRRASGVACSCRGGRLRRLRCGARARGSPRKLPSLTFGSLRSHSRGERVNGSRACLWPARPPRALRSSPPHKSPAPPATRRGGGRIVCPPAPPSAPCWMQYWLRRRQRLEALTPPGAGGVHEGQQVSFADLRGYERRQRPLSATADAIQSITANTLPRDAPARPSSL